MKKIQLKNKKGEIVGDYVKVNQRIMHFRENEAYKGWQLVTEILTPEDSERCLIKATIINDLGIIVATGHADERLGSNYINNTSHTENAETSAWGRALACLGIGIDTDIASYEEVGNAIAQQDDKPWMSHKDFGTLVRSLNEEPSDSRRAILYKAADEQFRMKKDYRRQLLEIVEQRDINV